MTLIHHNVRDDTLKDACIYCGEALAHIGWKSHFVSDQHYKSATCPCCGKDILICVGMHGSGHDTWAGKDSVDLENLKVAMKAIESAENTKKATLKPLEKRL